MDGIERCIDDEIPFAIPDNWCWVHLSNIMNVVSARRVHQSDWKTSGVPFYRAREVGKLCEQGYVDNELYISEELFELFSQNGVPSANDMMVTAVGTLGKTYVVKETDRFYYKDASVICFENFGKINPFYMQLVMASPYMTTQIKEHSSGTTVGTITISTASNYYVPVPPLAEQHRIVTAYNSLIPHLEQL